MRYPPLDGRAKAQLMAEIWERARAYAPQWRCDPGDPDDAGVALAKLFGNMFYETLERFNRLPRKCFVEFLHLMDVQRAHVTPAQGIAAFTLAEGAPGVALPKGTQVYRDPPEGERVIYETQEEIAATSAKLCAAFSVDPQSDSIQRLDGETPTLFAAKGGQELQRRSLLIAQERTLDLRAPAQFCLRLEQRAQYTGEEIAKLFADPDFARFSYYDGAALTPFDKVEAQGDALLLTKERECPLLPPPPREGEQAFPAALVCQMRARRDRRPLYAHRILLSSRLLSPQPPDALYAGDVRIPLEGGACFGLELEPYRCFYLASRQVLRKAGARVALTLQMRTLCRRSREDAGYAFHKFIVDKQMDAMPDPPKRTVSQVAWEYWNGAGWTHLAVEGDVNPFDGSEGPRTLTFLCPEDLQEVEVAAEGGLWIRARIVFVENAYAPEAETLLPYLNAAALAYDDVPRPAQRVAVENNGERSLWEGELDIPLYQPMEEQAPAVYLLFDQPPEGYPVSLYLQLDGDWPAQRLRVERSGAAGFEPVRHLADAPGLSGSGCLRLYLPKGARKMRKFSMEGYFLRAVQVDGALPRPRVSPRVQRLALNAVRVVQQQCAPESFFDVGRYEAGKRVQLDQGHVTSCEVWARETGLSGEEQRRLRAAGRLWAEPEGDATYVRWEQTDALEQARAQARRYRLDAQQGEICFGDGVHGRVPPAGRDALRVVYAYGGGSQGNAPLGALQGVLTTAAGVAGVTNVTPLSGGNDAQPLEEVERLGPWRVKHRFRAVTSQDFEHIVQERFRQVRAVRCFPNTNGRGRKENGCVTVAVLPDDPSNQTYARTLCGQVYDELAACCDGVLLAGARLCVLPAALMRVNATVTFELDRLDAAAEVEREALVRIQALLAPKAIGRLPAPSDFYSALKDVDGVAAVREVLLEGVTMEDGARRAAALDGRASYPFAVPVSGEHIVRMDGKRG